MAGCCAFGCSSRSEKGYKLYRFPTNPQRRRIWMVKVSRKGWTPTSSSCLCEKHFDEYQFEKVRVDGKMKLKSSAVPTIFCHRRPPKTRKPPVDRHPTLTPETKTSADPGIIPDHNYCLTAAPEKETSTSENGATDDTQEAVPGGQEAVPGGQEAVPGGQEAVPGRQEADPGGQEAVPGGQGAVPGGQEAVPSEQEAVPGGQGAVPGQEAVLGGQGAVPGGQEAVPGGQGAVPSGGSKSCVKMRKRIQELKSDLRETRIKYKGVLKAKTRQEEKVSRIFAKDQLKALSRGGMRGVKWSASTVEKALQLRYACGSSGYRLLLQQNYPLPSERTLQRRLENARPGKLNEVLEVTTFDIESEADSATVASLLFNVEQDVTNCQSLV